VDYFYSTLLILISGYSAFSFIYQSFAHTHIYTYKKAQTPSVAYRKLRPSLTYQTINNNETYADMTTACL